MRTIETAQALASDFLIGLEMTFAKTIHIQLGAGRTVNHT